MVQAASASAGLRTINRVEQTLQDLRVNLKPKVPTKVVCAEHLELRKEILTLLNLQKQLQYKETEGSSYREGPYTETPDTPKVKGSVNGIRKEKPLEDCQNLHLHLPSIKGPES